MLFMEIVNAIVQKSPKL